MSFYCWNSVFFKFLMVLWHDPPVWPPITSLVTIYRPFTIIFLGATYNSCQKIHMAISTLIINTYPNFDLVCITESQKSIKNHLCYFSGQNNTNVRRFWKLFHHKTRVYIQSPKSTKKYGFEYNGYCALIKYI